MHYLYIFAGVCGRGCVAALRGGRGDFGVNFFESSRPAGAQREVYRRIFKTEGGKKLFRTMFTWE